MIFGRHLDVACHSSTLDLSAVELAVYVFIVGLSAALTFRERPIHDSKIFILGAMLSFALVSLVVRTSGFDADMEIYAAAMADQEFGANDLREPVVWFGQYWLHALTGDPTTVFIVFDIAGFAIMLVALTTLRVPQYAIISIIAFFPFIMGMQNIYRQWFAACLFLLAMASVKKSPVTGIVALIAAIASHSSALFFSSVFFQRSNFKYRTPLLILSMAATPLALFGAGLIKSDRTTGLPLEYAYLTLFAGIAAALYALDTFKQQGNKEAVHTAMLLLVIVAVSTLFFSSLFSERVSLFGLMIIYPVLALSIEHNFERPIPFRLAFAVLGFAPALVFGVRKFIL